MQGSNVTYKEIPGFPGYHVGDDGSVWSCWFPRKPRMTDQWRQLKPHRLCQGKRLAGLRIRLRVSPGKKEGVLVHRLVLMAFVGPCPPGMEGCHNDGNPANNRVENLRWDTPKGNMADTFRHGTQVLGSRVYTAKLKEVDIPVIRSLREKGESNSKIGRRFGVAPNTIQAIFSGYTWKHV